MRRLFSSFAAGPPAAGLLVLRAVAGVALIVHMLAAFSLAVPFDAAFAIASGGIGALLLIGLWTPLVAALGALDAVCIALSPPRDLLFWLLVAAIALAITLMGPGRWSIDARLFGWKRLDFGDAGEKDSSPH